MNREWHLRGKTLRLDRPLVMGILNVTPDSFSDGGRFFSPDAALTHADAMIRQGADIIDVGGESTRPRAVPVSEDDELRRVIPVIQRLAADHSGVAISIDTVKSTVARQALDAGAHIVNDVSGLRLDPRIANVCAETSAGLVLMHSRGGSVPELAAYERAIYADVVADVLSELRASVETAQQAGVADTHIAVDPGIGFAKTPAHSVAMLSALPRLADMGFPVVVGVSKKRFIGDITGVNEPDGRLSGTLGATVAALALGARIFRVHDVRENREALDVAWKILGL